MQPPDSRSELVARTSTKPLSRFGTIVSRAIVGQEITAAAVARAAKIHPTTLWRWMTGDGGPRAEQAKAIAMTLGLSVDTLLSAACDRPKKKISARS
jgi:transcriptional regulator with XRE-family HTH domain